MMGKDRPKGVEIFPKITKMCVRLNGTNCSTQANEAESGGFRRGGIGASIGGCAKERHDQMPLIRGSP